MEYKEYIALLRENKPPKFLVMFCEDADIRRKMIEYFVDAHHGKLVYKTEIATTKQARVIGKKPVNVLLDWEPGIKKPESKFLKVNHPTLLLYTKTKSPSENVLSTYKNMVVVVPPPTGQQVTTLLTRKGLSSDIVEYLKAKTDTPGAALNVGGNLVLLANDLGITSEECFSIYFKPWLKENNIDEEPTEFLNSILNRNYNLVFDYLESQAGNEFYVYASILNWIEDIIKFCSCDGKYWENAGLVYAKYHAFQEKRLNRIPYVEWIRLYKSGLSSFQSLKINESQPLIALEVFVCSIIQMI